ncbi:MAG: fibronectin type III domain-containing protein [Limisphaerales bacterium]
MWAVLLLFSGQVRADVLAGWETTGLSGFGPSPFAPNSTANPNLTIGGLTRGSGLTTGGSAGASAWGGVNFAGTDAASAVGGNDFATFTVTANPGYSVSFTDIPGYNVRRSNTGPKNGIWQYQVGSGDFTDIGSAITWGSNTGAPGNSQSAIDLSGISDLQNVPPGTTVTFRIVSWGGGAAGTWYINNMSGADLQIEGTVSAAAPSAPSASDATSILSSGFTANWSPSDGATGYRLDVSPVSDFSSFVPGYEDLDVANVTSYVVSGLSIGTTYYYRVRAYNDSGTSDNSSAIAVTTASSGIPAMTVMLPVNLPPIAELRMFKRREEHLRSRLRRPRTASRRTQVIPAPKTLRLAARQEVLHILRRLISAAVLARPTSP